jgi:hypothetical protein
MESPDCGRGSHTTMGPDVLFPLFKGAPFFLPVIRPRKWLVTCSWEPMEKNTPRINGAAAGPGAELVGGGACRLPAWAVAVR